MAICTKHTLRYDHIAVMRPDISDCHAWLIRTRNVKEGFEQEGFKQAGSAFILHPQTELLHINLAHQHQPHFKVTRLSINPDNS